MAVVASDQLSSSKLNLAATPELPEVAFAAQRELVVMASLVAPFWKVFFTTADSLFIS